MATQIPKRAWKFLRMFPLSTLFISTMLATWFLLWAKEVRRELSGPNTSPFYLRVLDEETIGQDQVAFLGRSAATGRPVNPEIVSHSPLVFRWRWTLLDRVTIDPTHLRSDPSTVRLEFAHDPLCRNEMHEIPLGLTWSSIEPPATNSSGVETILAIPKHHTSLLPIASVRNALNWGGDRRLLSKTLPWTKFPYPLFIGALFLLLLVNAFTRTPHLRGADQAASRLQGQTSLATPSPTQLKNSLSIGAVLLGIFLVFIFAGSPVYDGNDDAQIITLLSGNFHFPPTTRALFINTLFTAPISGLYTILPTIPWYGVSLSACLTLACALFGFSLATITRPLPFAFFFSTLLISALYLAFIRTTFTLVAGIVLLSAYTALFVAAYRMIRTPCTISLDRASRILLVSGSLLIVLGSLIRFQVFPLVSLIALPFGLYLLAADSPLRVALFRLHRIRWLYLPLALSMVASTAAHVADQTSYRRSSAWAQWQQEHKARVPFLDTNAHEMRKALAQGTLAPPDGWTLAETQLASRRYLLDPQLQRTQELPDFTAAFAGTEPSFLRRLAQPSAGVFRSLWRQSVDYGTLRLLLLYLAALLLCASFLLPWRHLRHLLVLCLWTAILFLGIHIAIKHPPIRVSYSLFLAPTLVAIFFLALRSSLPFNGSFTRLTPFLPVAVTTVFAVHWHVQEYPNRRERSTQYRNGLTALATPRNEFTVFHYWPNYAHPVLARLPDLRKASALPTDYIAATPPAGIAREKIGVDGLIDCLSKQQTVSLWLPGETSPRFPELAETFQAYIESSLPGNVSYSVRSIHDHWNEWLLRYDPESTPANE